MNLFRYRPPVEEARRRFLVPLSAFFIVGGIFMAVLCCVLPMGQPFPFVRSEGLNRIILVLISIFLVADGIGLLFRNRIAWYALLAYCCLGVVVPIAGAFDPLCRDRMGGYETLALGAAFNSIIAVGIYLGTRPAFFRGNEIKGLGH